MPNQDRRPRGERQAPTVSRQHIVRRLIDYQRRLREGRAPSEGAARADPEMPLIDYARLEEEPRPVATDTADVVDLTAAEREVAVRAERTLIVIPEAGEAIPAAYATSEVVASALREALEATTPRAQTPPPDPAVRAAALEKTLLTLAKDLEQIRARSRDTGLAIDSRLAAMQEKVARALGEGRSS